MYNYKALSVSNSFLTLCLLINDVTDGKKATCSSPPGNLTLNDEAEHWLKKERLEPIIHAFCNGEEFLVASSNKQH